MKHYDFIIAGGGLSGLSLAVHLINSPLRYASILIIDRSNKDRDDRTWEFWTDHPHHFQRAVSKTWDRMHVQGKRFHRQLNLNKYRYQVIRGIDLYRYTLKLLRPLKNVEFRTGSVGSIIDGDDRAFVTVDRETVSGSWVFDSMCKRSDFHYKPDCHHCMDLHFLGWEIETTLPVFDPKSITFMDFRTQQKGEPRFFYLLPYSEHRALVEHTLYSGAPYNKSEFATEIKSYLKNILKVDAYQIHHQESGSIPISDRIFPRKLGSRVMSIGSRAGMIKPTTGYAFTRIQRDSTAILNSLLQHGHPFKVPAKSSRYRLYDRMMLHIICTQGERIEGIFKALFKGNPPRRIFRFLDEDGSLWENVQLIKSLPPGLFLKSLSQKKVLYGLKPYGINRNTTKGHTGLQQNTTI